MDRIVGANMSSRALELKKVVGNPSSEQKEDIRSIFSFNGFDRTCEYNSFVYRVRDSREPVCCLYYDKDKLAAMYAVVPVKFKVKEKLIYGYQSLDTMVDAGYRGQGLFQRTAIDAYDYISSFGGSLIYGFPNGNSFTGFKKYLGWKFLDPVPFLIRPINVGFFLRNKLLKRLFRCVKVPVLGLKESAVSFTSQLPADEDLDPICDAFCSTYNIGVLRDSKYVKDRYLSNPEKNYKFALYKNPESGVVEALGVFCIEEKHGGRVGYLMELLFYPHRKKVASKVVKSVLSFMSANGCDCALAWCFAHSPSFSSYRRNLFIPLPERLRPIELHFGFKTVGDLSESLCEDRKDWYLSYSDSDTV